ncbi:MAG: 4-(cytidine 5'-diphospho)-2-C-methyl-D-erythritol kinase [Rhodobacteraceae bacterium]|nr:4-(cytidine 5'-diphospho)-2-C-methyl-D-erythritol kinase [Paracoccaceae bacterium]
MTTVEAFAPAKVNLTLHVTGQREDGYHLLDSLVVFADVGDHLRLEAAEETALTLVGPEAEGLQAEEDNLVLRAARLMDEERAVRIELQKELPVSSGIGGGSSDAAATLRGLAELWKMPLPDQEQVLALGADVPVCLARRSCRMAGIGDRLLPVPPIPALDIVLVNPRVGVSTPDVFRALTYKKNPPMPPSLPVWSNAGEFLLWLRNQRNDLYPPASELLPVISDVRRAIDRAGASFAGMSGSGATCFGLFPADGQSARAACALIADAHPGWWCASGSIL